MILNLSFSLIGLLLFKVFNTKFHLFPLSLSWCFPMTLSSFSFPLSDHFFYLLFPLLYLCSSYSFSLVSLPLSLLIFLHFSSLIFLHPLSLSLTHSPHFLLCVPSSSSDTLPNLSYLTELVPKVDVIHEGETQCKSQQVEEVVVSSEDDHYLKQHL